MFSEGFAVSFKAKKRMVCLLLIVAMMLPLMPATVYAADPFSNDFKKRFINQIQSFAAWEYPYEYYALHDFDGDGIPELLMGRNNREGDPYSVYYAVYKFDRAPSALTFHYIGAIEESRYIVKDKYSNALIAVYADGSGLTDCAALFNYYISDNRVGRNTVLTSLNTMGVPSKTVYDTMIIPAGYYRNDLPVSQWEYYEDMYNFLGSYEELIVHDWRGFDYETVCVAVNSWRAHTVSKRPVSLSSVDGFTKTWQWPMYELMQAKLGPADTLIQDEYIWEINLWRFYGQQEYERFALHDLDGDSVPELLLGVRYLSHFAYDIYKFWNGEMRYIGSFESYGKYLAVVNGSRDIFAYDPAPNDFYYKTAKRVSFTNNMLKSQVLLATKIKPNKSIEYLTSNANNTAFTTMTRDNFIKKLGNDYVLAYKGIRTFDINIVPLDAALIMYVKTRGFTIQ